MLRRLFTRLLILLRIRKAPTLLPLHLDMLPAHNGDTLLISFEDAEGNVRQIWIDGGLVRSFDEHHQRYLQRLHQHKAQIDLMMVTHIDQDHIGGVLAFCEDETLPNSLVKQFWFNSSEVIAKGLKQAPQPDRAITFQAIGHGDRSLKQGLSLETHLEKHGHANPEPIEQGQVHEFAGANLSILSPDHEGLEKLHEAWEVEKGEEVKSRGMARDDYDETIEALAVNREREDRSISNGSSIAFVFEYQGRKLLMLGDAHSSVVIAGLQRLGYSPTKRLKADAVKLSHHASKASNTSALLDHIDTQVFLVSTNGSRHGLPNKEALARIILHPKRNKEERLYFVFNHDTPTLRRVLSLAEQEAHNVQCIFPAAGKQGITLQWDHTGLEIGAQA